MTQKKKSNVLEMNLECSRCKNAFKWYDMTRLRVSDKDKVLNLCPTDFIILVAILEEKNKNVIYDHEFNKLALNLTEEIYSPQEDVDKND